MPLMLREGNAQRRKHQEKVTKKSIKRTQVLNKRRKDEKRKKSVEEKKRRKGRFLIEKLWKDGYRI